MKAGTRRIDANQEMLALGVCNLAGSFVKSMPVTGSFSRTAVNYATGVKTPASGIYTGILVLLVNTSGCMYTQSKNFLQIYYPLRQKSRGFSLTNIHKNQLSAFIEWVPNPINICNATQDELLLHSYGLEHGESANLVGFKDSP